jgi:hypothetical protein
LKCTFESAPTTILARLLFELQADGISSRRLRPNRLSCGLAIGEKAGASKPSAGKTTRRRDRSLTRRPPVVVSPDSVLLDNVRTTYTVTFRSHHDSDP